MAPPAFAGAGFRREDTGGAGWVGGFVGTTGWGAFGFAGGGSRREGGGGKRDGFLHKRGQGTEAGLCSRGEGWVGGFVFGRGGYSRGQRDGGGFGFGRGGMGWRVREGEGYSRGKREGRDGGWVAGCVGTRDEGGFVFARGRGWVSACARTTGRGEGFGEGREGDGLPHARGHGGGTFVFAGGGMGWRVHGMGRVCVRGGRDGLAGSWGRLLAGITGGEGWVGGDGGGMDGRTTGWVGAGDGAGEDGSPHARGHGGGRGCWFLCLLLAIVGLSRGRGEVKDLYMKAPCVYMLASKPRGTLYVGATSDLVQRVWQHKGNLVEGFTRQYRVHRLVWYEVHESMESARAREKALKKWYRAWKVRLVEKGNPTWLDLYEGIV